MYHITLLNFMVENLATPLSQSRFYFPLFFFLTEEESQASCFINGKNNEKNL